jgi:hypothetical protein
MAAFTKGDSRINRKGRPRKGQSLTEALEKAMKKKRTDGTKNIDALADTLIRMAVEDRNIVALKYVYDRLDGKPRESVDAVISGGMNLSIGLPPSPEEVDFDGRFQ